MAADLVNLATSEKLTDVDWMKNIEVCELVGRDHRQAKDVIKAIKKRLGSKNPSCQLFSVMLLEMLMNNIGEPIHRHVIDLEVLPILVKIVKKKSDLPVREKIFLLLDATQTSLGGASGRFPQYYSAYYDLVSAGVQFPQRPHVIPTAQCNSTMNMNVNRSPAAELASSHHERDGLKAKPQIVPESSIISKAGATLEVLREVLDAVDTQHLEGAKDEFTLDLVEQCSFQKQRVMHLAMTSRDEKVVSRAIDLNEQLEKVLARHEALISCRSTSISDHFDHEVVEEEEEPEQLFRRIIKGKACVRPEDGDCKSDRPLGSPLQGHRPLIRPLTLESKEPPNTFRPTVTIPPPPAKHVEREKFFQENKPPQGSALSTHMRGLSLHSRNASSSGSGSIDSIE